jgi:hypothetical protein
VLVHGVALNSIAQPPDAAVRTVGRWITPANQCAIVTAASTAGTPYSSVATPVTSNISPLEGAGVPVGGVVGRAVVGVVGPLPLHATAKAAATTAIASGLVPRIIAPNNLLGKDISQPEPCDTRVNNSAVLLRL